MNIVTMKIGLMAILLLVALPVLAEADHSAMGHDMPAMSPAKAMMQDPSSTGSALRKLASVPTSGKAREGGFDGHYVMESIDTADDLQVRCAKASRGLMMMDNAEWVRCGGKPEGIPKTAASVKIAQPADAMKGRAGHNM